MKRNRYTYQDVYNIFKKENWTLLSSFYKDNKQLLDVLCENNHKLTINLNNFLTGWRCAECAGRRKLTIEIIRTEVEKLGYKLLTKRYINTSQKLQFSCSKGHKYFMTYAHFYSGQRCSECYGTKKYTLKQVREVFKNRGWKLLSLYYNNSKQKLKVKCNKGHITNTITLNNFLKGSGCDTCYKIHNVGENNPSWNPNLTDEDRIIERNLAENVEWIKKVLKRDNYKCQCCGNKTSGNLNVHHLEGYHWCKELRFEVSNGVTLCKDCHKEFHRLFGTKWNTSEQFYIFLRNNNNETLN